MSKTVMEKKAEDQKKQEYVPEKSASIPDVEDDTKSVNDPVMEKKAEDEKKQEHVPEESADITLKVLIFAKFFKNCLFLKKMHTVQYTVGQKICKSSS